MATERSRINFMSASMDTPAALARHPLHIALSLQGFDWVAIARFVREWQNAFDAGRFDAMAALYADSALLVADGMKPVAGRAAISDFWRNACERAGRAGIRRTIHFDQYDSCGDIGYLQGTVCLRGGGGDVTVVWFVTVWQRHVDGAWRIVADTSSVVVRGTHAQSLPGVEQPA